MFELQQMRRKPFINWSGRPTIVFALSNTNFYMLGKWKISCPKHSKSSRKYSRYRIAKNSFGLEPYSSSGTKNEEKLSEVGANRMSSKKVLKGFVDNFYNVVTTLSS